MSKVIAPRTPWSTGFPDVIVHASLEARKQHSDYPKAKAGDFPAALALVRDLLNESALGILRQTIGQREITLAAVTAVERTGFNAIPDAMAHIISGRLDFPVDGGELRQTNIVAHTRATGWHRIVTPPTFGGMVEAGRDYVLIDDHVGLGGTLANMRGYIEKNGGHVIAMTTLTQSREASKIALTTETLNVLRSKYEKELEEYWQELFGYGFDCLTEVEAGYIARQSSADAVRRRLAEAAEEAGSSGLSTITVPSLNPSQS